MKKWAVLIVVALFFILPRMHQGGSVSLSQAFASDSGGILGVDQLMKDVDRHKGSVRVEGVVSAVTSTKQKLFLIDSKEFKKCAVTTCATLTLPIHWSGPMPAIKDTVRVQGEVKEEKGKLVFEAKAIEKVTQESGGER